MAAAPACACHSASFGRVTSSSCWAVLKDGVTRGQAESELASLMTNWGARAARQRTRVRARRARPADGAPVLDEIVGSSRRAFWVLQAAVGLVLLIACANLANLLMVARRSARSPRAGRAHGPRRRPAAAARAVRRRRARAVVLGGALGLARGLGRGPRADAAYPETVPRVAGIAIDPAVLGFTLLVSVVTGSGLRPGAAAIPLGRTGGRLLNDRAIRRDGHPADDAPCPGRRRSGARGGAGGGRGADGADGPEPDERRCRIRSITARDVRRRPPRGDLPGVRSARAALSAACSIGSAPCPASRASRPCRACPPSGTTTASVPTSRTTRRTPERSELVGYYQTVTNGYFDAMGIPIVRGRAFEETDRVRRARGDRERSIRPDLLERSRPDRRRVRPRFGDQTPWVTVVGVARDVKQA